MAEILTICQNKGGCGKTALSYLTAMYEAEKGKRVLCIDTDPQGNLSGILVQQYELKYNILPGKKKGKNEKLDQVSYEYKGSIPYSGTQTKELFDPDYPIDQVTPMKATYGIDLIHMVPNDFDANFAMNPELGSERFENAVVHLGKCIESLKDKYDLIILDLPPASNVQVMACLAVTDWIVVPLQVASHSEDATIGEIELFKRLDKLSSFIGVVINRVKYNSVEHNRKEARLRESMGDIFFETTIHDSTTIDTSSDYNIPLQKVRGSRKAYLEVSSVIDEIFERIEKRKAEIAQMQQE